MEVVQLTAGLRDSYRAFVAEFSHALLYQSLRYVDFLREMLPVEDRSLVAVNEDGKVVGALPLLARDGRLGTVLNSLPFFGSNGGILTEDEHAREQLIRTYNERVRDPSVASATLISNPLDDGAYTGLLHNLNDHRIGQISPIRYADRHAERLLAQCHYKTRNMIRKAGKSGIEIAVENEQTGFLRAVHEENLAALEGIAKPAAFFDLLPKQFRQGEDYRVYTARHGGELVAALLVFYFNRTAEYFMPVIRHDCRELQPMSALAYAAMCDASREGYWWWNWGGTWHTQAGVYRFKARWGAFDRSYKYYVQLNRRDIAESEKHDILAAYPYFYVLPFKSAETESP